MMQAQYTFTPEQQKYLTLLSLQYPTVEAASTEIIRLRTILNLPKGTEHFLSDIHGEYEAFLHILNSASGEAKEKLTELFGKELSSQQINDLATLIYYPGAKLALVSDELEHMDDWYRTTIHQLIQFCRFLSGKHTRQKVRTYIPEGYCQIIEEMMDLCHATRARADQ